jgi:hypothetical protein
LEVGVVVIAQVHKTATTVVRVEAQVTITPRTVVVPVLLIKALTVVTVPTVVHLFLLLVVEEQALLVETALARQWAPVALVLPQA